MSRPKAPGAEQPEQAEVALFRALIERAESGDESAMPEVRKLFDRTSAAWEDCTLAEQVERGQLAMIAGDNLVFREGIRRELRALKEGLAGPQCSLLERLLVERIAACWLQAQYADWKVADLSKLDSVPFDLSDYRQRRQDGAHKRLLSAIRTLATVRKLALPVLQVNIADQQINVAQAGATALPTPAAGPHAG